LNVPSTPAAGPASPQDARPLWNRDFTLFIVSLALGTMAIQIQAAVVGYQMYEITRDPLSLGALGLAEALPFISLALVGGHIADLLDRRRVMVGAFAVLALGAAALWFFTSWRALLPSLGLKWGIYGVIAVSGVCRAFLGPARAALSAQLVPRALFPRAIAWRTGVFQLAAVTGPAAGGLLYGWLGGEGAYLVALALLLAAGATMLGVRGQPRAARPAPGPILSSVRAGMRFLVSDPVLLPAITLDLFAVLFGGAVALLPIFAEEILNVGPKGYGLLRAAPAAGAVIASAAMALLPPTRRAGRFLLVCVAGFGAAMIGFALSRSFAVSLVLLAAGGALDMGSVLVRSTLLQLRVPDEMLGRVAAINQIFIGSSNEIGAFESGVAARLLGTVPSVVFGGMATLTVVGIVSWRAPALRRLGPLVP
jgi:MFS family permease